MKIKLVLLAAVLGFYNQGYADVNLRLSDGDSTPLAKQIDISNPATFSFSITLESTAEATSGLDYFLQSDNASSEYFSIIGVSRTNSTYSSPFSLQDPTTAPDNLLDPTNNVDLGAGVANVITGANGIGSFFVATITLQINPSARPGTYSIKPFNNPGEGYVSDFNNGFAGGDFTVIDSYTVTLVPEPSTYALMGIAGIGAIGMFVARKKALHLS